MNDDGSYRRYLHECAAAITAAGVTVTRVEFATTITVLHLDPPFGEQPADTDEYLELWWRPPEPDLDGIPADGGWIFAIWRVDGTDTTEYRPFGDAPAPQPKHVAEQVIRIYRDDFNAADHIKPQTGASSPLQPHDPAST